INIVSQSANPDGSITYELNLFLDLGGSDVAHYGFTLAFLSASNNPIVMPGGFDPLISQSDLTSGISDDLIGLIGSDVNSIANDTDWAQYENRTDVLSYESNGIFPSASTDYSMTLFVTVMGCVEDIEFDSNTNSGNPVCIYTANTGQVRGKGKKSINKYSFKVPLHSGLNKFRVTQKDNSGEKRISKEVIQESSITSFTMSPSSVRDDIFFYSNGEKQKTRYEVWDAFGNLLKIGYSDKVDCRNIVNGIYYMNYDNKTEKFLKAGK
ncbi:hypothetical protein N9C19_00005, partial [bacterium]|nr:hypothetical protein [bacterium]